MFNFVSVYPQQQIISGTVSDFVTKTPMQNVQLLLAQQNKGTLTNSQGRFSITTENLSDSLIITHVGYKPKILSLKTIRKTNTVYLLPDTLVLPDYSTARLTPASIVRLAYHSISQNYDSSVCRYEATVSYKKQKGEKLFYDGDFTFDILTRYGYPDLMQDTFNLRAVLLKGTERVNTKVYEGEQTGLKVSLDSIRATASLPALVHLLLFPIIENYQPDLLPDFLQPHEQKHYRYSFQTNKNSAEYIIAFRPKFLTGKHDNKGQITIGREDFSVIGFSYEMTIRIVMGGMVIGKIGIVKYGVRYRKENGKYYLQHSDYTMDTYGASMFRRILGKSILDVVLEIKHTDIHNNKVILPENCLDLETTFEELSVKYKDLFQP
jgi:hypothetical protein